MKNIIFLFALMFPCLAFGGERPQRSFETKLSGFQSVPQVETRGRGEAEIRFNSRLESVSLEVEVENLSSPITSIALSCGVPGRPGFIILELLDIERRSRDDDDDDDDDDEREGDKFKVKSIFSGDFEREVICITSGSAGPAVFFFDVNNPASLLHAIRLGVVFVEVFTENYPRQDFLNTEQLPGGELRGQFFTKR